MSVTFCTSESAALIIPSVAVLFVGLMTHNRHTAERKAQKGKFDGAWNKKIQTFNR